MNCPQCKSANDDEATHCFTCGAPMGAAVVIRRGSVVGSRYEILDTLGKGGMGTVYKAYDRILDEHVALKILRPEMVGAQDLARRFRLEIKLARKVRHKNVCGIHEYGEEGSLHYIAMEYIEGVDLRKILTQQGPPPPGDAFEIAIAVAQGLAAIHEAGIIHRDLKTSNIMVDGAGRVRLMDFGIAKQHGHDATLSGTAVGMIVGTPEYMSPEQARGEKVDFRSDVYAMGVVVFEIFTGTVPFRGDTPIATIFKQLHDPPPLEGPKASRLPQSVVPLLAKTLAKKADDRYRDVPELLEALKHARTLPQPQPATPQRAIDGTLVLQPAAFEEHPTAAPTSVPTAVPTAIPSAAAHEIAAGCAEIDQALARGEIDLAAALHDALSGRFGNLDAVHAAALRIVEARHQADEAALEAARDKARRDHAAQQEAAARKAAIEQRIEALLAGGDLEEAGRALAEASARHGGSSEFPTLARRLQEARERLDAQRRQAEQLETQQRRAAELRRREEAERQRADEQRQAEADAAAERDRLRAEEEERQRARAAERQAREEEARRRTEQKQKELEERRRLEEQRKAAERRAREEEERRRAQEAQARAEAVAGMVAHGEELLAAREFATARKAVEDALGLDPKAQAARDLLDRIDREWLAFAVEETGRSVRALLEQGACDDAAAELDRAERSLGRNPYRPLRRLVEQRRKELQQQKRAAAGAAPKPAVGRRAAIGIAAGVAATVLVAGSGIVWMWSRSPVPSSRPAPAASLSPTWSPAASLETAAPPPTVPPDLGAAQGVLIVDALPWGEVTEVLDARGRPQVLGSERYTPLFLRLPAGDYTVVVHNPASPAARLQVAVAPARVETRTAHFDVVSAEEYLGRTGF